MADALLTVDQWSLRVLAAAQERAKQVLAFKRAVLRQERVTGTQLQHTWPEWSALMRETIPAPPKARKVSAPHQSRRRTRW